MERPINLKAEKIARQNKNLHGADKVEGLTGRWRGIYYEKGQPRGRFRFQQPLTHIGFYRR